MFRLKLHCEVDQSFLALVFMYSKVEIDTEQFHGSYFRCSTGDTTAIAVRAVNIPINLSINFHSFCKEHGTVVTCSPKQNLPRHTPECQLESC